MAGNTAVKERPVKERPVKKLAERTPSDVMFATFADNDAARGAYHMLRALEREGQIKLDSAVVIDRDAKGHVRVTGARLPAWLWATIAGTGLAFFGVIGGLTLLVVTLVRRSRASAAA